MYTVYTRVARTGQWMAEVELDAVDEQDACTTWIAGKDSRRHMTVCAMKTPGREG